MDLDKLETVWREMRETQYLTEEQIKKLKELLGSFNKINTNIAQNEENAYKNIEILKEIIVKLNNIAQNNNAFTNVLQQNKDELSNLLKGLEDYKKRLELDIKIKINETLTTLDNNIKKYDDVLASMINSVYKVAKNVAEDQHKIIGSILEETQKIEEQVAKDFLNQKNEIIKEFDERKKEIVKNLKTTTNFVNKYMRDTVKEVKQKTFMQRWGIVITGVMLGIGVGVGGVFYKFKNDIVFSLKYSSVCYNNNNNKPYKCYVVPPQVASINAKEDKYLIQK